MEKIILAVDGGATKTAVILYSSIRGKLFSTVGAGSNYQAIGAKKVEEELSKLLAEVAELGYPIDAAVFAIAGIDTLTDKNIVNQIVENSIATSSLSIQTYVVENDVEATMLGLCQNKPGALLISGTGAIAYSYNGEDIFRAGGWGHRVGDEGSGYWIGQTIAQAIFKSSDGRGEQTRLTDLVLQSKKLTEVDALMNWLYRPDYRNADLASLGSLLQQAIDEGDNVALSIAKKASHELFELAIAVLKPLLTIDNTFNFYLNGGVLKNNPTILTLLQEQLKNAYPAIHLVVCEEKPIRYIINRALIL